MSNTKAPDRFNDEDRIQRMRRAKALLEDPILGEAFEEAEQDAIRDWRMAQTTAERELAWHAIDGLDRARRKLRKIVSEGEYTAQKSSN
jgi:hypothetical protein